MAGILKGVRNPQASRSLGVQRFAAGGNVSYEYNPYQRGNWNYGKAPTLQEYTAPVVDVEDEVVDTTTSNGSTNSNGIVDVTTVVEQPLTVEESYTDTDRPNWAEPESPFVPGHEDYDWSGPGGTSYDSDYSAVVDAYDTLPVTVPNELGEQVNVAPGNFTPVTQFATEVGDQVDNETMREIQNQHVVDSFENYGENILNNPNLTNEQIAAANPAFNQDAAINHAANPVTITNPTSGDSYTIPAGSLTSEDFANALPGDGTTNALTVGDVPLLNLTGPGRLLADVEIPGTGGDTGGNYEAVIDDYGYIDGSQGGFSGPGTGGDEALTQTQYDLSGNSVAGAGIRNIGGSFAQDGDTNAPLTTTRYNPETGRSEVVEIYEQPVVQEPEKHGIVNFIESLTGHSGPTVQAGPNAAQQFGESLAARGQQEGKARTAARVAEEQQLAQTHAGISADQYNSLSGVEQIGVDIGKDVDLSSIQSLMDGDDSGYHGTARGNLSRQGLSTAQVNKVIEAFSDLDDGFLEQGALADIQASQPKTVGQNNTGITGGITNALNIGSNPATTAAGSDLYSAAQGSDIIAGTGGQTRAQVQAQNLEGIDLTHESASSQRKDAADSSARQTTADEIGQAVALDPSIAELRSEDAKEYLNSVGAGNFAKEDAADALQSFIADAAEPAQAAPAQAAPAQSASYDTAYNNALENLDAEATEAGYTSAVGKVLAEQHGWSAEQIAAAGYNRGGIVHRYADGGKISIKPANRGIFTAKAENKGMGVQAYARKILAAPKGKYSPSLRKQANFARNASKWN